MIFLQYKHSKSDTMFYILSKEMVEEDKSSIIEDMEEPSETKETQKIKTRKVKVIPQTGYVRKCIFTYIYLLICF